MKREPIKTFSPGLADAIERARYGRTGAATDADAPPLSTLPMTKAARVALRLSRAGGTSGAA